MGARGRVCPRCGRGSLFGELVWIAVLGMLLLGIAILSGLIPMDRIPGLASWEPTVRAGVKKSNSAVPTRTFTSRGQPRQVEKVEKAVPPESTLAYGPCSSTDTYALRLEAKEAPHRGPHTPAVVCREASDSSSRADLARRSTR
jgi:hypothetical protein